MELNISASTQTFLGSSPNLNEMLNKIEEEVFFCCSKYYNKHRKTRINFVSIKRPCTPSFVVFLITP